MSVQMSNTECICKQEGYIGDSPCHFIVKPMGFWFEFVLPSPTQHGILLAGLRSLLTRGDVPVRIVPVNKHQTSGKLLVAKHRTSKVILCSQVII